MARRWWFHYGIPWASLSSRQRAVALGVARGWSDKEIVQALGLRPSSVRMQLNQIRNRLGLVDRVSLRQWMRMGRLDHALIAPLLNLEDPPLLKEEEVVQGFPALPPKRSLPDRWKAKPTG